MTACSIHSTLCTAMQHEGSPGSPSPGSDTWSALCRSPPACAQKKRPKSSSRQGWLACVTGCRWRGYQHMHSHPAAPSRPGNPSPPPLRCAAARCAMPRCSLLGVLHSALAVVHIHLEPGAELGCHLLPPLAHQRCWAYHQSSPARGRRVQVSARESAGPCSLSARAARGRHSHPATVRQLLHQTGLPPGLPCQRQPAAASKSTCM